MSSSRIRASNGRDTECKDVWLAFVICIASVAINENMCHASPVSFSTFVAIPSNRGVVGDDIVIVGTFSLLSVSFELFCAF